MWKMWMEGTCLQTISLEKIDQFVGEIRGKGGKRVSRKHECQVGGAAARIDREDDGLNGDGSPPRGDL
jgi:hypothetical protein